MHAAAELGPLPRYTTRRAYNAHIDAAPLVHLSGFRHPWRLHDIMNMRHLEAIWARVAAAINATGAADPTDPAVADPLVRQCLAKIAGACWALTPTLTLTLTLTLALTQTLTLTLKLTLTEP